MFLEQFLVFWRCRKRRAPPQQATIEFSFLAIQKEHAILMILPCSNFSPVHCRANSQYYSCRVRAGKRTQKIRVRSSCFGCLATLQRRYLESQGSSFLASTAGGRWARCGLCCLFERYKHVFGMFFSLLKIKERKRHVLLSKQQQSFNSWLFRKNMQF